MENSDIYFTHTTKGFKFNNLYKETIIFPIKIKELSIHSSVSITIFDFNKEEKEGLIGSTCFYVFDKKRRLRQGIKDLAIHKNQFPDHSYQFTTPGFPEKDMQTQNINVTLSKISKNEPKDKQTPIAIRNRLHQLYLESEKAYLEITLPVWDEPVIFHEENYTEFVKEIQIPKYIKSKYTESFLILNNEFYRGAEEEKKVPKQVKSKINLKN